MGGADMMQLETFNQHRPLLFSIAYHMLGSVMDAEDMVQETYLRWQALDVSSIEAPKAYLSTIITRLCINQQTSAQAKREDYIGPWLPEPIVTDLNANPESAAQLAEMLSMAFLVILESLSPVERAVYLLRKVFDYDYADIAVMLGKTEANCRQIVSRVQRRLWSERPPIETPSEAEQQSLISNFLQAWTAGDLDTLLSLLAEDVVLHSDGGGKVAAARRLLVGSQDVCRLLIGIAKTAPKGIRVEVVRVNGQAGLMSILNGQPVNVLVVELAAGRIRRIFNIVNPDKLQHITRS